MDFNLTDPENGPVLDDSLPNSVHEYVSWNFLNQNMYLNILGKNNLEHISRCTMQASINQSFKERIRFL